ncbi:MAG: ATP-binding protein, partial [Candidatus Saganbacteria bacterium]|nr:ATP-binding protein [Candidatus Saganbacteria bacterium]
TLSSIVLGLFVFLAGRKKSPNVTLALYTLSVAFWSFGQFMSEVSFSKPQALFWAREHLAAAVFIPVFYLHFVLSFLDMVEKRKKVLFFAYGLCFLLFVIAFTPLYVSDVAPKLIFNYYPVPGPFFPVFTILFIALIAYGLFELASGLKNAAGIKRNQIIYILFASVAGFAGGSMMFLPVYNIGILPIGYYFVPVYILVAVYAIVRHKLLDINIVSGKGLLYSTFVLLIVVSFISVILMIVVVENFTGLNSIFASAIVLLFTMGNYFAIAVENARLHESILAREREVFMKDKLASLGTLAAGMAHEIKNPLAAIKGLTQVLHENYDDPGFRKNFVEIIPRQLDRINNIVEDLLRFGKPSSYIKREMEVNNAIESVLKLLERECSKNNIKIIRGLGPLPKVYADFDALGQAFMNIILNAIQAMPEGGTLSIKSDLDGAKVNVEISDTGAGIPEENLKNIFDPFFTTKDRGAGLGLCITYRIIKEHGGEIKVESKVGEGTKFKVLLPTTRPNL